MKKQCRQHIGPTAIAQLLPMLQYTQINMFLRWVRENEVSWLLGLIRVVQQCLLVPPLSTSFLLLTSSFNTIFYQTSQKPAPPSDAKHTSAAKSLTPPSAVKNSPPITSSHTAASSLSPYRQELVRTISSHYNSAPKDESVIPPSHKKVRKLKF